MEINSGSSMQDYCHQYPNNGPPNMQYTAHPFHSQIPLQSLQQYAFPYPSPGDPAYAYKHNMFGASNPHSDVHNKQNFLTHQIRQDDSRMDVLNQLDINSCNLSRSSSTNSTILMDLTHSKSSPTSQMTVDENFNNNCSQTPPSARPAPSGANIRITDIESSPLNREDNRQMNNCTNETQRADKDLSNNYVHRILSRTLSGKIELRKQKYLEEKMKERQETVIALPSHTPDNGAQKDSNSDDESESEEEDGEDEHDSDFDEYEVELVDKLNRNKICELVMEYEVDHHGYLPSKERQYFIRDSLVEVFIYEDIDGWLGESEEGVLKGRIKNKLKTLRERATEWGMWKSPYVRQKKSEVPVPATTCINYFKDKKEIDEECRKKFREFRIERIEYFKSASIPCIASDIQFLFTKEGIELLVEDYNARREGHEQFEGSHQNKDDTFMKNWSKYAPLILKIAQVSVKNARYKKHLKAILGDPENKAPKSQDHIENLALLSLPHILGPVQCTIQKRSSNSWKASAAEAQESFILHVKESSEKEIDGRVTALSDLFAKHNLPLNPYVIAYGKLKDIKYCYVVINGFRDRIDGPRCLVRSVDICFKLTSALFKPPPKPASHTWQFLKKHIYGQRVEGTANVVIQLISNIKTVKIKPSAPKKRKKNNDDSTKVTKRASKS